jgi:hypothetical protein
VGDSIRSGTRLRLASLGDLARREITILLAAVLPVTALLLGAVGWIERSTAALARGRDLRLVARGAGAGTTIAVGVNVLLGLAVVALEVALGH